MSKKFCKFSKIFPLKYCTFMLWFYTRFETRFFATLQWSIKFLDALKRTFWLIFSSHKCQKMITSDTIWRNKCTPTYFSLWNGKVCLLRAYQKLPSCKRQVIRSKWCENNLLLQIFQLNLTFKLSAIGLLIDRLHTRATFFF